MYTAKNSLILNIIRHELAHMMTYIQYGLEVDHHGVEFRDLCRFYGWGPEVSSATMNLIKENEMREGELACEKIISRVQKLLKLAQSQNAHEAKLATAKANQLLLQYNLQQIHNDQKEEDAVVDRVYQAPRSNAKMSAMYSILKSFYVKPVYSQGEGEVFLEVLGDRANVEIARYVCDFLDGELDRLWLKQKKDNPSIKGLAAKNSFIKGVAEGYHLKMQEVKKSFATQDQKSLMILTQSLQRKTDMAYGKLGSRRTNSHEDLNSKLLGISAGKNLSINPALKKESSHALLDFFN